MAGIGFTGKEEGSLRRQNWSELITRGNFSLKRLAIGSNVENMKRWGFSVEVKVNFQRMNIYSRQKPAIGCRTRGLKS